MRSKMQEENFEDKLDAAFLEVTQKIDKQLERKDHRKKSTTVLTQELRGLEEEQHRLIEEIRQMKEENRRLDGNQIAALAQEKERLQSVIETKSYWNSVADIFKSFFHMDFKCSNPEEPTKVTVGFFKDSKGVCHRSIPVLDDLTIPTMETVDNNWRTIEHISQPKRKRSLPTYEV